MAADPVRSQKTRRLAAAVAAVLVGIVLAASGCAVTSAERLAPASGAIVEVEGERIHLIESGREHRGAAPSVILIHGASVNARDMQIALGDRLSRDRHVIAVDRPGRGYSTRPEGGHDLASQARLIRAAAASVGAERPVVVGQSFGGAVALAYALEHQGEMSGLVLLAPVSHEWPGGVAWHNRVSATPGVGVLLRRLIVPVYGRIIGRSAAEASFAPDVPPPGYYERAGVPLLFRPHDFRNNAADIVHLKAQIVAMQDRYGALGLPIEVMTGDSDTTVSPRIHAYALAKAAPAARLTVFEGVGHALHHARADEIMAAIRSVSAGQAGAGDIQER